MRGEEGNEDVVDDVAGAALSQVVLGEEAQCLAWGGTVQRINMRYRTTRYRYRR